MTMQPSRPRRARRRALALAAAGLALSLLAAAPAGAVAPQPGYSGADAGGLVPQLFGGPFIFPPAEARNTGETYPYIRAGNGAISPGDLPDFPGDFGVGLLGQLAIAYPSTENPPTNPGYVLPRSEFGNPLVSAACAGLIDANGTLEIGDTGECTMNSPQGNGIVLDLGAMALKAGGLNASCTVDQNGYWESAASFVNARIVTPSVIPGLPDATLFEIPLNPTRNFGPNLGVAKIVFHEVVMIGERGPNGNLTALGEAVDGEIPPFGAPLPEGAAGIEVNAGNASVLNTGFKFGNAVCYKSVAAEHPDGPVIPAEGAPVAALTAVALIGGGVLHVRRRRDDLDGTVDPFAG